MNTRWSVGQSILTECGREHLSLMAFPTRGVGVIVDYWPLQYIEIVKSGTTKSSILYSLPTAFLSI